MQRLEIQVLRARQLKICERASWFWTLIRDARIYRGQRWMRKYAVAQSAVAQSDQYDYCLWMHRIPDSRGVLASTRLSFKIFRHLSLSLYLWTYVRSSFYNGILSAMLVYVGLKRALCPLLVIRSTVLLFLRPLLSHTLFLVCTHVTFVIMQFKSQVLFRGLCKFRVNLSSQ